MWSFLIYGNGVTKLSPYGVSYGGALKSKLNIEGIRGQCEPLVMISII